MNLGKAEMSSKSLCVVHRWAAGGLSERRPDLEIRSPDEVIFFECVEIFCVCTSFIAAVRSVTWTC